LGRRWHRGARDADERRGTAERQRRGRTFVRLDLAVVLQILVAITWVSDGGCTSVRFDLADVVQILVAITWSYFTLITWISIGGRTAFCLDLAVVVQILVAFA
jgi:hypothetical protein